MSWQDAIATIGEATRNRVGPATTSRVLTQGDRSWRGVEISPVELHRLSGIDRDTYAIGRCVKSEVGDDNPAACLALAETVHNAARAKSISPYHWLTGLVRDGYEWTQWHYGEQHGRRASTRQDPTRRTITAATLGPQIGFVGEAITWYDPRVQDGGKQGTRALRYDAIGIAEKWATDGLEWIGPLPGVDSYRKVAFLRRVKGRPASPSQLIALIEAGRRGDPTVGTGSPHGPTRRVAEAGTPWWILALGTAAVLA